MVQQATSTQGIPGVRRASRPAIGIRYSRTTASTERASGAESAGANDSPGPPAVANIKAGSPRSGKKSSRLRKKKKPTPLNASTNRDMELLDRIRDAVMERLSAGELELKVGDGMKAVELKMKLAGGDDTRGVLVQLIDELRRELLP